MHLRMEFDSGVGPTCLLLLLLLSKAKVKSTPSPRPKTGVWYTEDTWWVQRDY